MPRMLVLEKKNVSHDCVSCIINDFCSVIGKDISHSNKVLLLELAVCLVNGKFNGTIDIRKSGIDKMIPKF